MGSVRRTELTADERALRANRRGIVIVVTIFVLSVFIGLPILAYVLSPVIRNWVDNTIIEPTVDALEEALVEDD